MPADANRAMTVQDVAEYMNVTIPTVYRAIAEGRIPQPFYPASRAPRWHRADLDAALAATRLLPRDAKVQRRNARLAGGYVTKAA